MAGPPAARLGDPTAHGGMIVVGCPTVLIGNKPAARIGDMHVCPQVTGVVPHVGGPLALGAFTVLVGGVPQSRQGDLAICVGPPDSVLMGEPTVQVGMAGAGGAGGLLGAVLGGVLAGLKNFVTGGYPRAVLDAHGNVVTQYSPAITIEGTPQFQSQVLDRLSTMSSTESGQTVIDGINGSGKSMTITEFTGNNSFSGPNATWDDVAGQSPKGHPIFDGNGQPVIGPDGKTQLLGTGDGANTTLQFNPNLTLPNSHDPDNPMPNDAILMHEMNHGAHQMNGEADMSPLGGGWDTQEEETTISTGDPSEADYLEERGYPYHRTDHGTNFAPN